MRKLTILSALVAGLFSTAALADWTGKDAANATITFKNAGVCTSVVCVPQSAITDSTGVTFAAVKAANTVTGTDVGLVVAVANTNANAANNANGITPAASAGAPVVNYAYGYNAVGNVWDRPVLDACERVAQSYAPISITTATTTRIVAPSASNKTYICSLFLTSAAADNVGIVEGTGGTCGTGTAGVIGGTTAANGPNFAANGGVLLQAGGKVAIAQTAGTNVDLCLIT